MALVLGVVVDVVDVEVVKVVVVGDDAFLLVGGDDDGVFKVVSELEFTSLVVAVVVAVVVPFRLQAADTFADTFFFLAG